MVVNVLTWEEAIKKGYEPRLYPFSFPEVPLGDYKAMLDFKIWAKKIMAISCYFTQTETTIKFQLTVYCRKNGSYEIPGSDIDFSVCSTGCIYQIQVMADQKKKIHFLNAASLK